MKKLPSLNFRQVKTALERLGLAFWQGKGSHVCFHPPGKENVHFTLPSHGGDIDPRLVKRLLKWLEKLGISRDDFLAAL